jgi:hypothetical protein
MSQSLLDLASPGIASTRVERWGPLADCLDRVPDTLRPWLAEPGLLTARVRTACGSAARLRLLRLDPAPRLPVAGDRVHLWRSTLGLRAVGAPAVHCQAPSMAAKPRRQRTRRIALRRRGRAPGAPRVPGARRGSPTGARCAGRRGSAGPALGTEGGLSPGWLADPGAGGVPAIAGSLRLIDDQGVSHELRHPAGRTAFSRGHGHG